MAEAESIIRGTDDGAIVALCEKVLKLLAAIGLVLLNVAINPMLVGVHPDSRDGLGIKTDWMHRLAFKIMRFGFRWSACTDAICIEEDGLKSSSTFTVKLQSRSSKLDRQASNDILYGSLACSHLNQWLVAALCSAECTDKEMSIDGRMSADCIRAKQPELRDALDSGLSWTIVKSEAAERWPQLPKLIQKARQIAGLDHPGETQFELLQGIQSLSVAMADETGAIDWEYVRKAASCTDSRCIDDIPSLCILVQKHGGGSGDRFISKLLDFVKSAVPDNRRLPSNFWSSLSKLDFETSALSFIIWAIVKAEAAAPPHAVSSGVTHYITSSHVSVLAEGGRRPR